MVNPYKTDDIHLLANSHKQAMAKMHAAAVEQGAQGLRAVDLWQQLTAQMTAEEATEAGQIVLTKAAEYWAVAKSHEVNAIDSLALSLGTTRDALLAELAALPPTFA